jgi:hypothetical protein
MKALLLALTLALISTSFNIQARDLTADQIAYIRVQRMTSGNSEQFCAKFIGEFTRRTNEDAVEKIMTIPSTLNDLQMHSFINNLHASLEDDRIALLKISDQIGCK